MKQRKHQSLTTKFAFVMIILHLQNHGSDASHQQTWISISPSTLQGPRTPEELQAALNVASDGDTIDLLPIAYTGDFILQSRNPADKITVRGTSQSTTEIIIDDEPIPVKVVKPKPWFRLSDIFLPPKTVPVSRKYSIVKKKTVTRIIGKEAAFRLVKGDWTLTSLSIESGGVTAKSNGEIVRVLGVPTCAANNEDFSDGMEAIDSSRCGGTTMFSLTGLFHATNANNETAAKLKLTGMKWEEKEFWDSSKKGSWDEHERKFDLIVPIGHEEEEELFPTCNA
jgi:hypothetical protein